MTERRVIVDHVLSSSRTSTRAAGSTQRPLHRSEFVELHVQAVVRGTNAGRTAELSGCSDSTAILTWAFACSPNGI